MILQLQIAMHFVSVPLLQASYLICMAHHTPDLGLSIFAQDLNHPKFGKVNIKNNISILRTSKFVLQDR